MKPWAVFLSVLLSASLAQGQSGGAPADAAPPVILQKNVPVFSVNTPHEQRGFFPQGGSLQILCDATNGMVRVRFQPSSGKPMEGLCRKSDLQPPASPAPLLPGRKPPGEPYGEREWLEDSAGLKKAVETQNKLDIPMLIFFYADWNDACDFLWKELLNTLDFKNQTKGIIKVRVNPEHGKDEGELAARYNLHKYPSTFMIDKPHATPRRIDLVRWSFGKMKTLTLEKTLLEIAGAGAAQPAATATNAPGQ